MLFTKEEYKQRLKKVQNMMRDKGIDLLISHDTNNLNYLTGYDAWSFYYAQCAIVHVDAEEPLCFVRAQDAGGAYIKTYLKKENIIVYDEHYIHTWPKHPYDFLVEIINTLKKKDRFKFCVSGGSTPKSVYHLLYYNMGVLTLFFQDILQIFFYLYYQYQEH